MNSDPVFLPVNSFNEDAMNKHSQTIQKLQNSYRSAKRGKWSRVKELQCKCKVMPGAQVCSEHYHYNCMLTQKSTKHTQKEVFCLRIKPENGRTLQFTWWGWGQALHLSRGQDLSLKMIKAFNCRHTGPDEWLLWTVHIAL